MRKITGISAITMRIIFCFLMGLTAFPGVRAQQNKLMNERLQEWHNMVLNNDVFVSVYVGYGSYNMSGMRKSQKDMVALSGLKALTNSDFPPYWLYGVSISQRYDASRFGFSCESMSTGARSSIGDYSGAYYSDFRCSGLKIGFFIEKDFPFKIERYKMLSFGYRIEVGGFSSEVNQHIQITINGLDPSTQIKTLQLSTAAPFFEPTGYANGHIDRKTNIQFSLGYMLDIPPTLPISLSTHTYPASWAGYRIKLGLVRQL